MFALLLFPLLILVRCLAMQLNSMLSSASEEDHRVYSEERANGLTPESLRRLSAILWASAGLGHEYEFWTIMERNLAAVNLLDCRTNVKCPLEMAILRGHYELARDIFHFMRHSYDHDCLTDLLYTSNGFMPFSFINKNKIDCVLFCIEIGGEKTKTGEFHADWGMATIAQYAKIMGMRDMLRAIEQELSSQMNESRSNSETRPFASEEGSPSSRPNTSHSRTSSPSTTFSRLYNFFSSSPSRSASASLNGSASDARPARRPYSLTSSLSRRFRGKDKSGSVHEEFSIDKK